MILFILKVSACQILIGHCGSQLYVLKVFMCFATMHNLAIIQGLLNLYNHDPPKWQKNDLVSGGHGRAAKLGACVNWVDWLRTSADKRMWSGRHAVVMVR